MVAIILAMFIILYEVFVRYVLRWPTDWEIEASIMLTTFVTFVGSAYSLKNNAHVSMGFISERVSDRVKKPLSLCTSFASMSFCVFVSSRSWQMFWEAYTAGWRSETTWGPPLSIPYGFMAVGMSLVSIQYLAIILAEVAALRQEHQTVKLAKSTVLRQEGSNG
jgi:TRAP-type C4-dicarboxylate transport system permease small subunit